MAVPRHSAIVTCSCGAKWGNAARAARSEEAEAAERAALEIKVATMIRHHALGHKFTFNGPLSFAATIAKAAEGVAERRGRALDHPRNDRNDG